MDPARLTSNPIFAELDSEQLARLAAFATEESHPVGARLVREGDFSTELFVIEEGTADVVRGGQTIDTVGVGDVVGEIGVLRKAKRTADVVATTPLLVIKITHWELRRLSADTIAKFTAILESRAVRD
jgi:CRP/FNR family transcriptional regulator, cyclic AMP receptor protein